jgi:ABC-type multidrug transport system fused ATPase/permease subunit
MKIPLRQYLDLLSGYLKPQWRRAALLAVLLFASIAAQLINPQIMRFFIDTATAKGPLSDLRNAALIFIGVALLQQLVSVAATYTSENVGWTATNALRADIARHCLNLDAAFHNKHTPGEMIERLEGDVTALSNFFSQFVVQVLGNAVLMLGVLALLFREDWRIGLALGGFALITLLAMGGLRNIAVKHWTASREAFADFFSFLEERLAGTEDIRSCGAKPYVMRRFFELQREMLRRDRKANLMMNIMINLTEFLYAVGNAAAFTAGAWVYSRGLISVGTVFLVFSYANLLIFPIQRITRQLQDLQKAGAGIARIQDLMREQPKITDGPGGVPQGSGPLSVAFEKVSFSYDDQGVVFSDLSFELGAGAVLGLLGRTGSGKTTISRLLFRLYEPQQGVIRLGGIDIREQRLSELRQRVGMVTQSVQLFNATVRENLTFFDPTISDSTIMSVIDELGLRSWFATLPKGLDSEIESGGAGLSAGEAQLLAFTRIFLRNPGLVILDEASSRLDLATEQLIERAVDRLLRDRTGIVIAHRLATVQRADVIMIIEDGRILEYGRRQALLQDPGSRFSQLMQTGLEEMLV